MAPFFLVATMNFVIEDVRRITHRKDYKPSESQEVKERMLPLKEYLELARRMIGAFAPEHARSMMLGSDDAIAFVADKIMRGDWAYDPNYKSKSGKSVSLNTFRGRCGKWGIQEFLRLINDSMRPVRVEGEDGKVFDTNLRRPFSIYSESPDSDQAYDQLLAGHDAAPIESVIQEEDRRQIDILLKDLTESQKRCVIMYYIDDMEFHQIARKLHVSRQAVQANIRRGMKKLKRAAGVPV